MSFPKYFFSIESMSHHSGAQRFDANGIWQPPRQLGGNLRTPNTGRLTLFHFDGVNTRVVAELPNSEGLCRRLQPQLYKTWSIYHDQGTFWTVDCDATRDAIGIGSDTPTDSGPDSSDGDEDTDSDDEEDPVRDEWQPMSFCHKPRGVSYATRRGTQQRLAVRRSDQLWSERLLTNNYTAPVESQRQNEGGMIGELPLLIALMAFSLPDRIVSNVLPMMLKQRWAVPPQIPRESGWQDRRGMVVSVYTDPGSADSTTQTLRDYEMGRRGLILP